MASDNDQDAAPARMLYLIVCGAPPAAEAHELVKLARDDDWDVCVIATAMARNWIDAEQLAELSGRPVRTEFRMPDEGKSVPPADVIVVAPATLTTISKFRHAIADNHAVATLCECLGAGVPIVVAPNMKRDLEVHAAYQEAVRALTSWGVRVMEQAPIPRGTRIAPWDAILAEATGLIEARRG